MLDQKVDELLRLGKPHIGFGLATPDKEILDSLEQAKEFADITLVGPEKIKDVSGFEKIIDTNPEEKMAHLLADDAFDGIIRGTIDDFKTYETYCKLTNESYTFAPAVLEDPKGRQFMLTAASNPDDWEKEDRLSHALQNARFLKKWGIKPYVAVLTGVRHETYARKKNIHEGVVGALNKTYEDAEWIVAELKKEGFEAKNWAIDLNPAVEAGANIICPVNGMVGNQMFRVLLFCGGKILTATRLGLSRLYEDNSRTEKDFVFHVKWLAALINKKKSGEEI